MKAIIITALSCAAVFVSILIQLALELWLEGGEEENLNSFSFKNYSKGMWFLQITWWLLQLSLFIWGMIELYPHIQ